MPIKDRRTTVALDNTIHRTSLLLDIDSRLALGYLQDLFSRSCGKAVTTSAVVRLALLRLAHDLAREEDLTRISRDLVRASKGTPTSQRGAARADARVVALAETADDDLPTFRRFLWPDAPDFEETNRKVEEYLKAIGVKTNHP
ncbi:hypothetical protein [Azohydromonas sediminis]|uniref:hypothetical protein n=1 Tax=Azohydromonas sediminis TaxID=2259674 RepID=UPI0013C2D5F9|nr:hypothetical protein [Azohydromonas sediminis]